MSGVAQRLRTGGWSAALSVTSLAVAGALGVALKQPWLFPSLGPSLMVLAETPQAPAARPRSVLVGHLVGSGAGVLLTAVAALVHLPQRLRSARGAPARAASLPS